MGWCRASLLPGPLFCTKFSCCGHEQACARQQHSVVPKPSLFPADFMFCWEGCGAGREAGLSKEPRALVE